MATGFDEELAHLIEAGADLFLMPSRFEPCGLNQMYSQRYGTPPVVRATGGLADTVTDGETGFLFERAEPAALLAAVRRALAALARAGALARDSARRDGARLQLGCSRSSLCRSLLAACHGAGAEPAAASAARPRASRGCGRAARRRTRRGSASAGSTG